MIDTPASEPRFVVTLLTGELKLTPPNWRVIETVRRVGGMFLRREFWAGDIVRMGPFETRGEASVCLAEILRVSRC